MHTLKYKHQQGLSLMEILIVLVLIVILASIAFPAYQHWRASQEMKNVQYLITGIIRLAKLEAFVRKQDIVLCPSIDGIQCTNSNQWGEQILMFSDQNQNRRYDAHELLLNQYTLNVKYALLSRTGARHANYIMFKKSNALPQGSQGHFMYCSFISSELSQKIILNAMGIYRVEKLKLC